MKDFSRFLFGYLIKGVILITIVLIIINCNIDESSFQASISNILTVSSIITGIVFAYLISKLFTIRAEREKRQEAIDILSTKLTEFRRLCQSILTHNYFWRDLSDIRRFKAIYPLDTFNDIHDQQNDDPRKLQFWSEDQGFSETRADLYLAFEQILDSTNKHAPWIYDRTASFRYSLEQIGSYYEASNQIWYYLDYRWNEYSEHVFDNQTLGNSYETSKISELINKIDETYKRSDIDRHIIARIGSDFHAKYLVELYRLTERNQEDLPTNLRGILWTQMIMLVFGVLTPLFLSSISLDSVARIYSLKYSLLIVSEGLLIYLFQLFEFSRQEIKV
ncbi:hypothetical protein C9994_08625 [Marivirga lumbricoides]|uniref:Uncharacterized protein n=1 Tax=Marivirga lumbricoides TaxID=1046115 RepID=A0A2T4DQR5_9BACT|nr:hypothetical protein C9994_08625 [Marivirga lumbricoides]